MTTSHLMMGVGPISKMLLTLNVSQIMDIGQYNCRMLNQLLAKTFRTSVCNASFSLFLSYKGLDLIGS